MVMAEAAKAPAKARGKANAKCPDKSVVSQSSSDRRPPPLVPRMLSSEAMTAFLFGVKFHH